MARPWVEYIQSQKLPWEAATLAACGAGIEQKVLSRDSQSGAFSALLKYPPGYRCAATALAADEEFLVLDGGLEIGGKPYGQFAYGHWPQGYDAGVRESVSGAVALTFYSASPRGAAAADFNPQRLVEHCDALAVPYTGNFHPEFPPGAGRKLLYTDPESGESSWILGTLPLRWAERSEVHPIIEEMYLLSGESHGDRGVMRPGAYLWRPGHVPHGPYGTLTGNLYFFRTREGGLSTTYLDPSKPFHWWPAYNPEVPEEFKPYAGEIDALGKCW